MIPYSYKNFIFDLDGTLIDSKSSILASLEYAFITKWIEVDLTNEKNIIGPPLDDVLRKLVPDQNSKLQLDLKKIFIERYDNYEYKNSTIPEGVELILKKLNELGKNVIVVTNKRTKPTLKIMKMFKCFSGIKDFYCIDSIKNLVSKKLILERVIHMKKYKKEETVYVGDTYGDFLAAKYNNIDFVRVYISLSGAIKVAEMDYDWVENL